MTPIAADISAKYRDVSNPRVLDAPAFPPFASKPLIYDALTATPARAAAGMSVATARIAKRVQRRRR
jgi:hypothetical protein